MSRKAQFFILSAIFIVSLAFYLSQWIEPGTIIDVSEVVIGDEVFIFNNLVEKAQRVVRISKTLEELRYNLDEYANFVESFALARGYDFYFLHDVLQPPQAPGPPTALAFICLRLTTPRLKLETTQFLKWPS